MPAFKPAFKPGDRVVLTRSFGGDETLALAIGYVQSMGNMVGMVGTVLWTCESLSYSLGVAVYAIDLLGNLWYWPESHLEWEYDPALTRPLADHIPEDLARQMATALRR